MWRSVNSGQADVARVADVSVATVSLALNNHPRVSARTRLRVQEAARRLGYVPNAAAKRMARARFRKAGVELNEIGFALFCAKHAEMNAAYLSILQGAESRVAEAGSILIFARITEDTELIKLDTLMKTGAVDGWLFLGAVSDKAIQRVRGWKKPLVVLGDHAAAVPVNTVTIDSRAGGVLAARALADMGHKRVAFLGATMRYAYQQNLRDGFLAEASVLGMPIDPGRVLTHQTVEDGGLIGALLKLIRKDSTLTGVFVSEPGMSSAVMGALCAQGIKVPGRLSVIGCENTAGWFPAGLARVELAPVEVGRAGAALLYEMATDMDAPPREIRIAPRLVAGLTCAAAPEPKAKRKD